MRPVLFANVLLGFYILHLQFRGTQPRFSIKYGWYQNMTFDMVQRGSMNITRCGRSMLNCMEIIRPEYICYEEKGFESICGVVRHECSNRNGPLGEFGEFMEVYENVCQYWQRHTRRFLAATFGPELGHLLEQRINATRRTSGEL